jgi:hypothetical protein
MPQITIDGKSVALVERTPALRPGIEVVVQGVDLVMPAPLYALQLQHLEQQAAHANGEMDPGTIARLELDAFVRTLRRNYPALPDAWVAEWDTADIWRLRAAYVQASQPPAEETSGEPESR